MTLYCVSSLNILISTVHIILISTIYTKFYPLSISIDWRQLITLELIIFLDIQYVYYALISSLSVLTSVCHNNFCGVWVDEITFPYYSQRSRGGGRAASVVAAAVVSGGAVAVLSGPGCVETSLCSIHGPADDDAAKYLTANHSILITKGHLVTNTSCYCCCSWYFNWGLYEFVVTSAQNQHYVILELTFHHYE